MKFWRDDVRIVETERIFLNVNITGEQRKVYPGKKTIGSNNSQHITVNNVHTLMCNQGSLYLCTFPHVCHTSLLRTRSSFILTYLHAQDLNYLLLSYPSLHPPLPPPLPPLGFVTPILMAAQALIRSTSSLSSFP
jgi:hypothetical protein